MRFQRRWIEGKTISSVEMNSWEDETGLGGRETLHDPVIYFDDGSSIYFRVQESYNVHGVAIRYQKNRGER